MKYNKSFGKLASGRIEYAPDTLRNGDSYIVSPSGADYLARGWLPVVDEPPSEEPPQGYHYAATGWQENAGTIARVYTLVIDPPAEPIRYSKLRLYAALVDAGLWDALESWLETQTIGGINAYTAFSLAQNLSNDYPGWDGYLAQIKSVLGLTDAQAEAILEAAREV